MFSKRFLFSIVFILSSIYSVVAAKVDTVSVFSSAMNRDIKCVVVSPESCNERVPVVYLLHGHGGFYGTWLIIKPELTEFCDNEKIMIICPDGEKSWYWDSPKNNAIKFETHIISELIPFIDNNYPTLDDRNFRAITGLSMGGQGAMFLAVRHKDIFGMAGSTSGGVDIRDFPNNWNIKELIGEKKRNKKLWNNLAIHNQIDKLNNGDLKLIIDCGYDDFFFEVNKRLHDKLMKLGIEHDYIVRPGAHNLQYWNNSIDYQLLFFKKHFNLRRNR